MAYNGQPMDNMDILHENMDNDNEEAGWTWFLGFLTVIVGFGLSCSWFWRKTSSKQKIQPSNIDEIRMTQRRADSSREDVSEV